MQFISEMLRVRVRARATQVRVGGLLGWLDGLNLAEPRLLDAVDDSDKRHRIINHVNCLSGRFIWKILPSICKTDIGGVSSES